MSLPQPADHGHPPDGRHEVQGRGCGQQVAVEFLGAAVEDPREQQGEQDELDGCPPRRAARHQVASEYKGQGACQQTAEGDGGAAPEIGDRVEKGRRRVQPAIGIERTGKEQGGAVPGVCIVARHVQDLDHGTIGIHPHRRPERHERRRSHRAPQDHFCKGGWLAIPPATQQGQQGGKGKQEDARAPGETAQPDGETRDDQIARATGVQVAAKGQHGQQRQAAQEPIEVEQPREGDVKRVECDEQKTDRGRQRTDLSPCV